MTKEYRQDALDASLDSTYSGISMGSQHGSLDDLSAEGKLSTVAQRRAHLEGSQSSGLAHNNVEDFYRQLKVKKAGEIQKKYDAAHQRHHFRGIANDITAPRKISIRNPVSPPAAGAADRAAAALFTSGNFNGGGTTTVRSLGDFFRGQREMRLQESASRKKTADLYHHYSSLVARAEPTGYVRQSPTTTEKSELLNVFKEKSVHDACELFEATIPPEEKKEDDSSATTDLPPNLATESAQVHAQVADLAPDLATTPAQVIENPVVKVDYEKSDYRGFIFVVHEKHGLLLLHCTRKPKKGPHYQLPGGHLDDHEFVAAANKSDDAEEQLLLAAQMGAARELYEETGLDVRDALSRVTPAALRKQQSENTDGELNLACELKKRLYFFLNVTDNDFISPDSVDDASQLTAPMTATGDHLRLKLSVEHSGFVFEGEPRQSAKLLEKHSGGFGSKALLMAMACNEEKGKNTQEDKEADKTEEAVESRPQEVALIENPTVAVDYKEADYRGFVFIVHEKHGLMLLHCTRKPKKGPHYQLAGGHIDEPEFLNAARTSNDAHTQLMIAAQMGAAREVFEETGLDVRDKLYRMEPAALRSEITSDKNGKLVLTCELKKRLYFFLAVSDDDYVSPEAVADDSKLSGPMTEAGRDLRLKLSIEHSGFVFEKDPEKAAKMLEKHSGGNGSKALLMALRRNEEDTEANDESIVEEPRETATITIIEHEETPTHDETPKHDETKSLLDTAEKGLDLSTFEQLPSDLLPPPKRGSIFSCCFCTDL